MDEYEEEVLELAYCEYDDEELEDDAEEMWFPLMFVVYCLLMPF